MTDCSVELKSGHACFFCFFGGGGGLKQIADLKHLCPIILIVVYVSWEEKAVNPLIWNYSQRHTDVLTATHNKVIKV